MTDRISILDMQDEKPEQIHSIDIDYRVLESLILAVIDEVLEHVFKREGKAIIYDFLAENYRLKQEQIAGKPEIFSTGLKKLLASGALVIENLILRKLHSKLGLEFTYVGNSLFSDQIRELRKKWNR